ncbi:hypothetical protein ACCS44_29765 [Rhizobium ruizarguesonis]
MSVDLSTLTPAKVDEFHRRREANLRHYNLTVAQADHGEAGFLDGVCSRVALQDVSNRRQPIWSKR